MKLRCRLVPRQLLFLPVAVLTIMAVQVCRAQDTITLRENGRPQPVVVEGMTAQGVHVQIGGADLVEPFSNILALNMAPPAEYQTAQLAYQQGELQSALANITPLLRNYRGLPTEWMQHAMRLLGDIYVAMGNIPKAEAAYKDYQRVYPKANPNEISLGEAAIDLSKKDYDAAGKKIAPILADGLKTANPTAEAAALIGRAFYISGQIKEANNDLPGALEDYLRTVVVFPQDSVAAADAQRRADALRSAHHTMVP